MGSQRVGRDSVTKHKGPGPRQLKPESGEHAPPLLRSSGGVTAGRRFSGAAEAARGVCAPLSGAACGHHGQFPALASSTSEMALVCGLFVSSCLQFVLTAHAHHYFLVMYGFYVSCGLRRPFSRCKHCSKMSLVPTDLKPQPPPSIQSQPKETLHEHALMDTLDFTVRIPRFHIPP